MSSFQKVGYEKIKENDYNLIANRYTQDSAARIGNDKWEMVRLDNIVKVCSGNSAPQNQEYFYQGIHPFFRVSDLANQHFSPNLNKSRDYLSNNGIKGLAAFPKNCVAFPKSGASCKLNHIALITVNFYAVSHLAILIPHTNYIHHKFLFYILSKFNMNTLMLNSSYPSIKLEEISKIQIPLPPIETQQKIVDELDSIQKGIDNAKQFVESLKKQLNLDSFRFAKYFESDD